MARSRNIKPGFFHNDELAELPPLDRLLFAGLWGIADREGRLEDRPKRIKAQVLPYDDHDVNQALDRLAAGPDPFVVRYQAEGVTYLQITGFARHQNPHRGEAKSIIPPPGAEPAPDKHSTSTVLAPDEHHASTVQEQEEPRSGTGSEVKGIRLKESGSGKQRDEIEEILDEQLREGLRDWLAYRREQHRFTPKARSLTSLIESTERQAEEHGTDAVLRAMGHAKANGWKSFDCTRGSPNGRASGHTNGKPKRRTAAEIMEGRT